MKNPILTLSLIALLSGGINNSYSQDSKSSKNSRVLIYGEDHFSLKQSGFITNLIDSLKNEKYNYFAMECKLKEFNTSVQRYLTSNKDYQDKKIKKLSKSDLEMLYAFYKNGFKIVLIDGGKDGKYLRKKDIFENVNERDLYMAENIIKILEKDSSAKIVVNVGAYHAQESRNPLEVDYMSSPEYPCRYKYPPMAGILKNKGIDPETIRLIDEKTPFFLPDQAEKEKKYFDKIIYLK